LSAAPVFSSRVPTSAPKIMTMPMLLNVPEKPSPMVFGSSAMGTPAIIPKTSDTVMIERNGWILYFEIATIITTIASTNTTMRGIPVI